MGGPPQWCVLLAFRPRPLTMRVWHAPRVQSEEIWGQRYPLLGNPGGCEGEPFWELRTLESSTRQNASTPVAKRVSARFGCSVREFSEADAKMDRPAIFFMVRDFGKRISPHPVPPSIHGALRPLPQINGEGIWEPFGSVFVSERGVSRSTGLGTGNTSAIAAVGIPLDVRLQYTGQTS